MGKITVKHYLNKKLKPDIEPEGNYYPLYVSLTVNKKNIRQRSQINLMIPENDFENKADCPKEYFELMAYEVDLFTRITQRLLSDINERKVSDALLNSTFNRGNSKDEFTSLWNTYLNYYTSSIFLPVSYFCFQFIRSEVYQKLETIFKVSSDMNIERVFKFNFPQRIEDFIFDNLSEKSFELYNLVETLRRFLAPYSIKTSYDVPLIDWLDYKIQPMLINFLNEKKKTPFERRNMKLNSLLIDSYIGEIDNIVSNNYIEYTQKYKIEAIQDYKF